MLGEFEFDLKKLVLIAEEGHQILRILTAAKG